MRAVLIGPPASGKGTIGRLLAAHFELPIINVGKLLRDIPEDSIWYQPIREHMNRGDLAPESIVGGFLDETTKDAQYEKGYILDGWLREISDLEHFDPKPSFLLYLNISEDTSRQRILDRRVCEAYGHTYSMSIKAPKVDGVCDIDGSPITHRKDDELKVLENRLKIFRESTLPVIEFYRKNDKVLEIDAEPLPDAVLNSAIEMIRLKFDSMI